MLARCNPPNCFSYSPPLEQAIAELSTAIQSNPKRDGKQTSRWLAIKLLEQDAHLLAQLQADPENRTLLDLAARLSHDLSVSTGEDVEVLIADQRYAWINSLTHAVVQKSDVGASASERIDRIVTHRWLGIPIFLLAMFMLFRVTSAVPAAYVSWLDGVLTGPLARWALSLFDRVGWGGSWAERLVVSGILPGVGSVLAFVPVLMALYLVLGLLEDSGYMTRAAFVVDRLMHTLGLHGKSFLPMIVGFGCSVPGIYATRSLENQRERILTGLLVPFMSCSARLPVYMLLASIFFPQQAGTVIFGLYLGGIGMAILVGQVLHRTLFRGMPTAALIMELPAYHKPIWKNIWRQTWERTSAFIHRAGTTIFVSSLLIWLMMFIPVRGAAKFSDSPVQDSLFAVLSQSAAPVFAPLGFGSWQTTGALASGLVAKEVVVSTLAQTYTAGQSPAERTEPVPFIQDIQQIGTSFIQATLDTLRALPLLVGIDLQEASASDDIDANLSVSIRQGFNAASGGRSTQAALAFLVFVLLYTPCVSALTVLHQELGARWMLLTAVGQFTIAWLAAWLVFQAGLLLI